MGPAKGKMKCMESLLRIPAITVTDITMNYMNSLKYIRLQIFQFFLLPTYFKEESSLHQSFT